MRECLAGRMRLAAALLGAALMGPWLVPVPTGAATTERIVVDRHTGLAISGFDPVAYFVDGRPVLGHAWLELRFAGATWRFANEGNRAAFAADPEVYMPRFGGYDAVAVTREVGTPGHPNLWIVARERLYLFYNEQSRDAFAADPDRVLKAAERRWPIVLRKLSP